MEEYPHLRMTTRAKVINVATALGLGGVAYYFLDSGPDAVIIAAVSGTVGWLLDAYIRSTAFID